MRIALESPIKTILMRERVVMNCIVLLNYEISTIELMEIS
jgi:hypothetical protein